MYFTLSSGARVLLGLVLSGNILSCIAAPADPAATITVGPPHPKPTIPLSCSLKPVSSCFTFTDTVTKKCLPEELIGCPTKPIACPLIIRATTLEVPCSTDCCPTTRTKTITKPCPGCITTCVIPTYTVTATTGCKSSGGALPTKTLL